RGIASGFSPKRVADGSPPRPGSPVMMRAIICGMILMTAQTSTAVGQATQKSSSAKAKKAEARQVTLLTNRSPLELLGQALIRKEVKLRAEQAAKREELSERSRRFGQEVGDAYRRVRDTGDPDAMVAFMKERRETEKKMDAELDRTMLGAMDREQCIRLEQIG